MGKVGKSRKRTRRQNAVTASVINRITTTGTVCINDTTATTVATGIEQQQQQLQDEQEREVLDEIDVEITESTLRLLLDHPTTLLKLPQARTIRTLVYEMVQVLGSSNSNSNGKTIIGRISDAIHDHRWSDAIDLFVQQQQQTRSTNGWVSSSSPPIPPLGALQRWIRDLFESSILRVDPILTYTVLYHILLFTGQSPNDDDDIDNGKSASLSSGPLKVYPMWYAVPRKQHFNVENHRSGKIDQVNDDSECDKWIVPRKNVLTMESAWREGMTLWSCNANDLLQDEKTAIPESKRWNVPFVPGAFLLSDVVSPMECARIVRVANNLGFTPEAFYSLSTSDTNTSTTTTTPNAADGVVWIVPECLRNDLLERVQSHLPSDLCGGKLVHLNSRWRIYRYSVGTVYRPHIDGAWTGSGIVNDVYVNDIYDGKVLSRLTFLLYLNDDFEHGGTTFYSPSSEHGCVVARSIAPIQGSILCFPHGPGVEHVGLVHEGSAVTRGVKYVMRSDVLYEKVKF